MHLMRLSYTVQSLTRAHGELGLTLGVVSLNPDGTVPDDRRVAVDLSPVGRLWASFAQQSMG